MSNVKNDNPLGNLWNSVTREAGRVANEATRHVTESIDDVSNKTTGPGGLLEGAAAALEKASPGRFVAGAIDSIIPGEDLPPPLADGIAAGVNFAVGTIVPGVGFPLQLIAITEAYSAVTGLMASSPPSAPPPPTEQSSRMQTPESPQQAIRDRIAAGPDLGGIGQLRPIDGSRFAGLKDKLDGLRDGGYGGNGLVTIDIGGHRPGRPGGKDVDSRLKKLEADLAKADADIDKILSNPNLSFEDMIFLLMRAVIKQSEAETKIGLREEQKARDAERGVRDGTKADIRSFQTEVDGLRSQVAGMAAGPARDTKQAELTQKEGTLRNMQDDLSTSLGDSAESRADRMEELKQAMQKVSEMQQALSNILNTLHQTAMNAIGNIR